MQMGLGKPDLSYTAPVDKLELLSAVKILKKSTLYKGCWMKHWLH